MNDEITSAFAELFNGLSRAYGQWTKNQQPKTVRAKLTNLQWEKHMRGEVGLGVIPIREDNTCVFGAIDIDEDTINHAELASRIEELQLPLIVCRSKSGGAHCYTFTTPLPASTVRQNLSQWAATLGYGRAEIFPKQDRLGKDEIGNWINLPYFNGDDTNRMAIYADGRRLNIVEFIEFALAVREMPQLMSNVMTDLSSMPPCLRFFYTQGVPDGARNEVLYNFGVYFKRARPATWEEDIIKVNFDLMKPPQTSKEVQSLIKSLARKDYRYKCKTSPISDFCDAIACRLLKHGIGSSAEEDNNYGELVLGTLTKIMTDPPKWSLEINGIDVLFTTEEIMDYRRVRTLCMELVDIIAPPVKNEDWLKIIKAKMANKRTVKAPSDATQHGHIQQALNAFIQMADRARSREDIFRGLPVKDEVIIHDEDDDTINGIRAAAILFKSQDFSDYLKRKKVANNLTNHNLWMIMRKMGCGHAKVRIGKRVTQVWYYPLLEEVVPSRDIIGPIEDEITPIQDNPEI